MGMTIEQVNKLLSVITATITEDDDCFTIEDENLQVFKESLLIAIDTMRKYQKIEDIYYHQSGRALEDSLRSVIEDGNID